MGKRRQFTSEFKCGAVKLGQLTAQDRRIRDLEDEVRKLRRDRDILKKATAFFANHGR